MIDIAIIGSGPAGLSAAINARARNKSVVVLGRKVGTSMLAKAERIDNHLGFFDLSGAELLDKFIKHVKSMDIDVRECRVKQIINMSGYFAVGYDEDFIEARVVIFANGVSYGKTIKGEAEYLGKGVSYCATCDGMLYRDKTVSLIAPGSGETFKEACRDAVFLSQICKKVYMIADNEEMELNQDNIEIINKHPQELFGGDFIEGVRFDDGSVTECSGAFIIKESIAPAALLTELEMDGNHIKANRVMETNIKGVFAAGDCTGWPFQLSKAIGEGLIAAQQAAKYIDSIEKHGNS